MTLDQFPEPLQAFLTVEVLASLFLTGDSQSGRQMNQPHGAFRFVGMLAAFTA